MTTFSTPEVCATTGVTYRMLDHWVRGGLIRPAVAGSGRDWTNRRWDDDDVAVVRVLAALSSLGFRMHGHALAPLVEAARSALIVGARWFAWDGTDWSVHDDVHELAVWASTRGAGVTVVDLDSVCNTVTDREVALC